MADEEKVDIPVTEEKAAEPVKAEEPSAPVAEQEKPAETIENESEPKEEVTFEAFDFSDKDLTNYDGEFLDDKSEEEEKPAETAEPETPTEEQPSEAETLKSELEAERAKHKALLEKLNFKDDDEALAYAEGKPIEQIREEAKKAAEERAKQAETFSAWKKEDTDEIVKAYPELSGKELNSMLEDVGRFASLRGDAEMRKKMSAVEAFEFVNRNKLRDRAAAAGAQKIASKAHLQPSKGKNVASPTSVPRDIDRMLGDEFTPEEKQRYFKLFST